VKRWQRRSIDEAVDRWVYRRSGGAAGGSLDGSEAMAGKSLNFRQSDDSKEEISLVKSGRRSK